MPLKVIVGGQSKAMTGAMVLKNGELKEVKLIEAWDGDEWKEVYKSVLPLTLKIVPDRVVQHFNVNSYTANTGGMTALPSGGRAPFTYSWTITGGAILRYPTDARPGAYRHVEKRQSFSGTLTCTCRDSSGQVAVATATYQFSA